jgi:hypothetical protein
MPQSRLAGLVSFDSPLGTAVESVWRSMVLALEKVAFQDLIQYILFTCYPFLTLFLNTADSASSLGELSSQDSH